MTDIPIENWIRKSEGDYISDKQLIPQNGKYNGSNPIVTYQMPSHSGIIPSIFDDGVFMPHISGDDILEVNFELTVKVIYNNNGVVAEDVFRYYVVVVNGEAAYPSAFPGENWQAYEFSKGDCGDTTVQPGQSSSCGVVTSAEGVPHRELKSNWVPLDDLQDYEDDPVALELLSRGSGSLITDYAAGDVGYDSGYARDWAILNDYVADMMDVLTDAYFDGTNPYEAAAAARADMHYYLDDFINSASEAALDRLIFSMEEEADGQFAFVIQNNSNGIAGSNGQDVIIGTEQNDRMGGSGGKDSLFGDGGNDYMLGGGGKDRIDPGSGKDKASGGGGKDSYYFAEDYDKFVVIDYNKKEKIYIDDSLTTRWKKLKKIAEDYNKGVKINFGDGDVLKLKGVDVSDLRKKSFKFVDHVDEI